MAYIEKRKGAYRIKVSNGLTQEGRRRYESTTWRPDPGMTPRQEEKALAAFVLDFERAVKSGKVLHGDKITIREFSDTWLTDYAEKQLEPTTVSGYRFQLRKYILPELGAVKLTQLQPHQLQRFYNRLSESGAEDGSGLSRASLKQIDAVLSGMYQAAIKWGYASENPCQMAEIPPDKKEKGIKFFTPEEAQTFLAILDQPMKCPRKAHTRVNSSGTVYEVKEYVELQPIPLQIKAFLYMAMFTGARRGELLALTWEDVNTEKRLLSIDKNLAIVDGQFIIKRPKNSPSNRVIAIQPEICELLQKWKEEQKKQRQAMGTAWRGFSGKKYDKNNIFIQDNGYYMHPSTPYHAFKKIIARYNASLPEGASPLPEIPLHGLRHTNATITIAQKIPVKAVSERLGHSNTSTTLNIYSHALKSQDEAAADALSAVLLKPKK